MRDEIRKALDKTPVEIIEQNDQSNLSKNIRITYDDGTSTNVDIRLTEVVFNYFDLTEVLIDKLVKEKIRKEIELEEKFDKEKTQLFEL